MSGKKNKKPTIRAAFIAIRHPTCEDLFLHGLRPDGLWALPGGTMEPGELPLETAVRELEEEAGISISVKDLQRAGCKLFNRQGGEVIEAHLFIACPAQQPQSDSENYVEFPQLKYLNPSAIGKQIFPDPRRNILMVFLRDPAQLGGEQITKGETPELEFKVRTSWPDQDISNFDPKIHDFSVDIYHQGKIIGYGVFSPEGDRKLYPVEVEVAKQFRRRGIATSLYTHAEKISGRRLVPSEDPSDDAKALWAQPKRPFGKSQLDKGAKGDWKKEGGYEIVHNIWEQEDHREDDPKYKKFGTLSVDAYHKDKKYTQDELLAIMENIKPSDRKDYSYYESKYNHPKYGGLVASAGFNLYDDNPKWSQYSNVGGLPAGSVLNAYVHPDYRRKGIATALYDHAEKVLNKPVHPSPVRSSDAKQFWAARQSSQSGAAPKAQATEQSTPQAPKSLRKYLTDNAYDVLQKTLPEGMFYVAFDGDDAGARVEEAALRDDVEAIQDISERIRTGSEKVIEYAKQNLSAEVVVHGGDDIGLLMPQASIREIEKLRSIYHKAAGFTITAGVGRRIPDATQALLWGKLHGKDQTVYYTTEIGEEIQQLAADLTPAEKIKQSGVLRALMPAHKVAKYELTHIEKGESKKWQKEGFTIRYHGTRPGSYGSTLHHISAFDPSGKQIGVLSAEVIDDDEFQVDLVAVNPLHQRKGLATAMYQEMERRLKRKAVPAVENQSPAGRALWSQPQRPFGKSERKSHARGWISPEGEFFELGDRTGAHYHPTEINYILREHLSQLPRAEMPQDDERKRSEIEMEAEDYAYDKGWISVGHGASATIMGSHGVLSQPQHPAMRKLRQLASEYYSPHISAYTWGRHKTPGIDGLYDMEHFIRHGVFQPFRPSSTEKSQKTKGLRTLLKGVVHRLPKLRYNPTEDVGEMQEGAVAQWQGYKTPEYFEPANPSDEEPITPRIFRDAIEYESNPAIRRRFLNRLMRTTESRRAPDGGLEFLLHRGMGPDELKTLKGKMVAQSSQSSWTPLRYVAEGFSGKPGDRRVSAWVHENNIATMPFIYGHVSPDAPQYERRIPGSNIYGKEFEVITTPHSAPLVTDDELATLTTKPVDIDRKITQTPGQVRLRLKQRPPGSRPDPNQLVLPGMRTQKSELAKRSTFYAGGLEHPLLRNPTPEQARNLAAKSPEKRLRYFVGPDNALYMWGAYHQTHSDMMRELGIPEQEHRWYDNFAGYTQHPDEAEDFARRHTIKLQHQTRTTKPQTKALVATATKKAEIYDIKGKKLADLPSTVTPPEGVPVTEGYAKKPSKILPKTVVREKYQPIIPNPAPQMPKDLVDQLPQPELSTRRSLRRFLPKAITRTPLKKAKIIDFKTRRVLSDKPTPKPTDIPPATTKPETTPLRPMPSAKKPPAPKRTSLKPLQASDIAKPPKGKSLHPYAFKTSEGYLLGIGGGDDAEHNVADIHLWLNEKGIDAQPIPVSDLQVRRDLLMDLVKENDPSVLFEVSPNGQAARLESHIEPHPDNPYRKLRAQELRPIKRWHRDMNFAFTPAQTVHTVRYGTPSGNFWVGKATWKDGSSTYSVHDTKDQARRAAYEKKQPGAFGLHPAIQLPGQSAVQSTPEAQPKLIVGANSYLRERIPFVVMQAYTPHVLLQRFSDGQYIVNIFGESRLAKGDLMVHAKGETAAGALKNAISQFNLAFAMKLEGSSGEHSSSTDTKAPSAHPQSAQAKAHSQWFSKWVYRQPKVSIKDVLHMEKNETIKTQKSPSLRILKAHQDKLLGGFADDKHPRDFQSDALLQGTRVEFEHTNDPEIAREIAMDHLTEDDEYYSKLKVMEEAGKPKKSLRKLFGHVLRTMSKGAKS